MGCYAFYALRECIAGLDMSRKGCIMPVYCTYDTVRKATSMIMVIIVIILHTNDNKINS